MLRGEVIPSSDIAKINGKEVYYVIYTMPVKDISVCQKIKYMNHGTVNKQGCDVDKENKICRCYAGSPTLDDEYMSGSTHTQQTWSFGEFILVE
jgi:hypothetical protein